MCAIFVILSVLSGIFLLFELCHMNFENIRVLNICWVVSSVCFLLSVIRNLICIHFLLHVLICANYSHACIFGHISAGLMLYGKNVPTSPRLPTFFFVLFGV